MIHFPARQNGRLNMLITGQDFCRGCELSYPISKSVEGTELITFQFFFYPSASEPVTKVSILQLLIVGS